MTITVHTRATTVRSNVHSLKPDDAAIDKWYRDRELELIASLFYDGNSNGIVLEPHQRRTYWQAPELRFVSPPIGLGRLDLYNTLQRVAVVQYALFNWAITEERQRVFARRSGENNLHTPCGVLPRAVEGYILPILANCSQVYDLIPIAAFHNNQMGARCERPKEAISAAIANRARREAEAEAYAAMQAAAPVTPAPQQTLHVDDRDYLTEPMRFMVHGLEVSLGRHSVADHPAPGAGRVVSRLPHPYESITDRVKIPPAIIDDTIITFGEDLFTGSRTFREGDWICICGTHNFANRTQCMNPGCRTAKTVMAPAAVPITPSRSALGDPGDWFCDFCGLCNWTRRAFCLRCCPLDADNIEEAITKGIVHFGDPIIHILRLGDKRAKALKKKPAMGAQCPCFGPHHGTRCHQVGIGVNATLWEKYLMAQDNILERLRAMPSSVPPPQPRAHHNGRRR
ncbi:hypothetical protein CcaverHIS002_0103120 [Cutaneotrichosporon cavernicola]|uniref:RanBP2-type domain-containing protein n=1 Tax=Cutaneotrichosporon cavernicola TaxID=279322 RepID=A0AA48IHU5_9TREE|nr:uncharacterized protein CcaverHIS019_0103060 [Cutaneotrichosporon cavernicola]BEI79783.1 hypothetical protein CcaverHIS002_0103120 [Cutaneotrichosporon cavernicola]BEI87588.1 hypothetical protein CcaverHIS019_0103060 [Cutaneotrichosporon cavernicola]BEI95359.1 hypothetical protein CcaverHIS631_0103080 [Cutaneotrichosporon cavernicola]BEJ03133.1 hypothetical protein CcaverHIS641_0103080 [Cutaneotrichosporon cavernicola]